MQNSNIKTNTGDESAFFSGLKGILWAILFTLGAFLVLSLLLAYTKISEGLIPFLSLAVKIVSSVICGFFLGSRVGKNGFISGLLSGGAFGLLLVLASILSEGGSISVVKALLTMLETALGGAFGGVLGVNSKGGKTSRKRR